MLKFGHITNYDDCGRVSVYIDEDDFQTEYFPIVVANSCKDKAGFTIDINALVAVIIDEKNPINGVCLGAINTEPRRSINKAFYNFGDGTEFEYDRTTHELNAKISGNIEISAKNVKIDSPIKTTHDIADKNGTMQAIRDFINNHVHSNGNNGSNTGVPTSKI